MTAILGICHRGRVWLAGDSACTSTDDQQDICAEPKVFMRGPIAIGHAGPLRPGEVLRHMLDVPRVPAVADLERYVQAELIPAMRKALADDGCITDADSDWGSALVGVGPLLYYVDGDFGAYRSRHGYAATGALSAAALVGLRVTQGSAPKKRLEAILEAVESHVACVRRPWEIVHT